jgi:hypothetical protein
MAEKRHKRNSTSKQQLLLLLFAGDRIILSNTNDNRQKTAYKINQKITGHGFNYTCTENKTDGTLRTRYI